MLFLISWTSQWSWCWWWWWMY